MPTPGPAAHEHPKEARPGRRTRDLALLGVGALAIGVFGIPWLGAAAGSRIASTTISPPAATMLPAGGIQAPLGAPSDPALASLRLGTVAGRVVDVAGQPVRDARVEAHVRYAAAGPLGSSRVAPLRAGLAADASLRGLLSEHSLSDETGRFEIGVTGVPPVAAGDRLVDLVVTAEGFAACQSCRLWVPLGGRVDDVTLVLLRAGSLRGRVVDDVGRPVPGVDVIVRSFDETRRGVDGNEAAATTAGSRDPDSAPRGHAVSDELGLFVVSGMPEGAVWVEVRDDGWAHAEPESLHVVHPDSVTHAGHVVITPRD